MSTTILIGIILGFAFVSLLFFLLAACRVASNADDQDDGIEEALRERWGL